MATPAFIHAWLEPNPPLSRLSEHYPRYRALATAGYMVVEPNQCDGLSIEAARDKANKAKYRAPTTTRSVLSNMTYPVVVRIEPQTKKPKSDLPFGMQAFSLSCMNTDRNTHTPDFPLVLNPLAHVTISR